MRQTAALETAYGLARHLERIELVFEKGADPDLLVESSGDAAAFSHLRSYDFDGIPEVSEQMEKLDAQLAELDALLDQAAFQAKSPRLEQKEYWSVGSANLTHPLREIVGGFLRPQLRVGIQRPISERVIAFIININDGEFLKRESHDHFGWHYHYLDRKKRRSQRILCWDTRAEVEPRGRPLFHERHGEGRYAFAGRPDCWGVEKRRSMHDACRPDLVKWTIDTFKHASKDAEPVWPTTAVLTTAQTATKPVSSTQGKNAKRHRRSP